MPGGRPSQAAPRGARVDERVSHIIAGPGLPHAPSEREPALHADLLVVAQPELWFATIERDVIARGVFTSVKNLARKIRRYIVRYSRAAEPFRRSYSDPTRRTA